MDGGLGDCASIALQPPMRTPRFDSDEAGLKASKVVNGIFSATESPRHGQVSGKPATKAVQKPSTESVQKLQADSPSLDHEEGGDTAASNLAGGDTADGDMAAGDTTVSDVAVSHLAAHEYEAGSDDPRLTEGLLEIRRLDERLAQLREQLLRREGSSASSAGDRLREGAGGDAHENGIDGGSQAVAAMKRR